MPVLIRDPHLEQQIDQERQRRGDNTMAKTLTDLARERLMQIETSSLYQRAEAAGSEEGAVSDAESKKPVCP